MHRLRPYVPLVFGFIILAGLSVWLQFAVLAPPVDNLTEKGPNVLGYYIQGLVLQGMDGHGKRYELQADRMEHYPQDHRAWLDRPRIWQIGDDQSPRRISANHGWLDNRTSEVVMVGNVRLVEGETGSSEDVYMGERMVVILDESRI